MLLKWIDCEVGDPEGFDRGQRAWSVIGDQPGFLGQGGGWSLDRPGHAAVFGWWRDGAAYEAFMSDAHDETAADQRRTYDRIQVRQLEPIMDIATPFNGDFSGATLLRLAHCRVHPDRVAHFLVVQAEVWVLAMSAVPGMLGGVFARESEVDFLVLSKWRTPADHDRYAREDVRVLRERADAAADLEHIVGDRIDVVPAWTIEGPATVG